MRRIIIPLAIIVLFGACYHDNASPFVHGAKNEPMKTGGTMVPATSSASEAGTTTMYDSSSGRAGGVRYMPDPQMQTPTPGTTPAK